MERLNRTFTTYSIAIIATIIAIIAALLFNVVWRVSGELPSWPYISFVIITAIITIILGTYQIFSKVRETRAKKMEEHAFPELHPGQFSITGTGEEFTAFKTADTRQQADILKQVQELQATSKRQTELLEAIYVDTRQQQEFLQELLASRKQQEELLKQIQAIRIDTERQTERLKLIQDTQRQMELLRQISELSHNAKRQKEPLEELSIMVYELLSRSDIEKKKIDEELAKEHIDLTQYYIKNMDQSLKSYHKMLAELARQGAATTFARQRLASIQKKATSELAEERPEK